MWALVTALVALILTVGGATSAHADDELPRPRPGQPWFGPELDIETAVPQDYADALGASPSSFSLVPGIDLSQLMRFRDPASGEVRNLYPDADHLFDYPTPWGPARRLLFLEVGPWATSILGLFVLFSLLTPVVLFLLRRRWWWVALAVSWSTWELSQFWHPHWSPAQAADAFPPLAWQLLLVHGLVLGYHRRSVVGFLSTRASRALALGWLGITACGAAAGWLLIEQQAPGTLLFAGPDLPAGRLLIVAAMSVVTTVCVVSCWRPLSRALGWVLLPMGRNALQIFVAHVAVLCAVTAALA